MNDTLYRRPLPLDAIAFASLEGRRVFAEALATGGLDGYFPLAEQFHTQSEPSFCGLGSLVVALNALGIDPGRLWKGPWRWFAEELLDCCVPLSEVRRRGLDVGELACLARCNGAEVELWHADETDLEAFRRALADAAHGETVLVVSYDRAAMDQTGSGHFSPIGGYHAGRDLVLVLDVARFKYPPHWVAAEQLFRAMLPADPVTGRARGWMALRRRQQGIALGFSVKCDGERLTDFAARLSSVKDELETAGDLAALARAVVPLVSHLEIRTPSVATHKEALAAARASLRDLPTHRKVEEAIGRESAEAATLLLLAIADLLTPAQRIHIGALAEDRPEYALLSAEVTSVRAQLAALWMHAAAERV